MASMAFLANEEKDLLDRLTAATGTISDHYGTEPPPWPANDRAFLPSFKHNRLLAHYVVIAEALVAVLADAEATGKTKAARAARAA